MHSANTHKWKQLQRFLLVIVMASVAVVPLSAKKKNKPPTSSVDRDYVSALTAANRFLSAWQTEDREAGLMLLSDAAKSHGTEDRVREFFSSDPGMQRAFQISSGKKLKPGAYTFPVGLFEIQLDSRVVHRRYSQIAVTRTGKSDWTIDRLP